MTAEEIRALGRQRDKELSNSAATGSAFHAAATILQAEALYEIAAQLAELNAGLAADRERQTRLSPLDGMIFGPGQGDLNDE